jgi:Flp pilus assembly protein TadG
MALKYSQHARRSTVLVEAALLFPFLLFLTFALLEYGWILLKSEQLSNAARTGARIAVRSNATSTDVDNAVNSLMDSANITGFTITISPAVNSSADTTITVTISVPYSNIKLVGVPFVPVPTNLQAAVSMVKEG